MLIFKYDTLNLTLSPTNYDNNNQDDAEIR